MDKYTYRVTWSSDDDEYIALCAEFPSLSWLDKDQSEALKSISSLVKNVVKDMKKSEEDTPEPLSIKKFNGKFNVRLTPEMHQELAVAFLAITHLISTS